MNKYSDFPPEDEAYILQHYHNTTVIEMAEHLGCCKGKVYEFLGLHALPTYREGVGGQYGREWDSVIDRTTYFKVNDHHDWLTGPYKTNSIFNDANIAYRLGTTEAKEPISRLLQRWKNLGLHELVAEDVQEPRVRDDLHLRQHRKGKGGDAALRPAV